jgi:hypothetical protein
MNKYILVTGDRNYNEFKTIENTVLKIKDEYPNTQYIFVNGDCRGADKISKYMFKKYGYKTLEFPADWNSYGKYAGPKRNKDMVDLKPELILIYHNNILESKGTKSCIKIILNQINKNENYNPKILFNNKEISSNELIKIFE